MSLVSGDLIFALCRGCMPMLVSGDAHVGETTSHISAITIYVPIFV